MIIELDLIQRGKHILHTAHRADTSTAASQRLRRLLEALEYTEVLRPRPDDKHPKSFVYAKQSGKEKITVYDDEGNLQGTVEFRTRTSVGGLGEGFDVWIADEAQELTTDQLNTLSYTVSSSPNPLIIYTGTPPTAVSKGDVFEKVRKKVFSGNSENIGWAEWSVDYITDPTDKESWYNSNPSMGVVLTERKVKAENRGDDLDFNIQRLGYWPTSRQNSIFNEADWDSIKVETVPKLKGKLFCGVKYSKNSENVSLSIAVKTQEDDIFFESLGCNPKRNGNGWILEFLQSADVQTVVIDGADGQNALAEEIKDSRIKCSVVIPKVNEVIESNSRFEKMLFAQSLKHMNQPTLRKLFTNCEKRTIGTGGGFGYQSIIRELDSSIMDSVTLAVRACEIGKMKKTQRVSI